jgi:hypothetical protein
VDRMDTKALSCLISEIELKIRDVGKDIGGYAEFVSCTIPSL